MKGILSRVVPVLTIVLVQNVSAATIALSSFNTGLDGWTGVPGQTTGITWSPTGGNPDGYIRNKDKGSTAGHIVAPVKFLGDWSALNGAGKLEWDFNLFSPGGGKILAPGAIISGPGGRAVFDGNIIPQIGVWTDIEVAIIEENWRITSGEWGALLSNVTELRLSIENVLTTFGGETTGIDNVMLSAFTSAVPLPPAAWLFYPALVSLFCVWARNKKDANESS